VDESGDELDLHAHLSQRRFTSARCAAEGKWSESGLGTRIVKQLCRELMLLESSDWQFLITTGAARDYAEMRFLTPSTTSSSSSRASGRRLRGTAALNEQMMERLSEIEQRDSIFPDIDPSFWAEDAHASRGDNEVEEDVESVAMAATDREESQQSAEAVGD
jgi:1,4-alpha-glucan branching enzyme